jgi:hypothetical protein
MFQEIVNFPRKTVVTEISQSSSSPNLVEGKFALCLTKHHGIETWRVELYLHVP